MKSIFASKTFWVGIGEMAFAAIGLFMHWIDQATAITLLSTGAGMIGLRLNTSKAVYVVPPALEEEEG